MIVLVITIIVMIILATVIILTLDSSNIIERANEAKDKADLANAKEVVALAKAEWELDKEELSTEYADVTEYVYEKLEEAGYKTEGNGAIMLSSTGAINTIYVGSDDRQAIIPEGFKVSSIATEDTVTEGLVIKDNEENEFVWIPVDDFSKFQKTTTYDGTITVPTSAPSTFYVEPLTSSTLHITDISLYSDELERYAKMRASVEENGGFYIARYEAGLPEGKTSSTVKIDGTDKPISKKGVAVWNNIPWDSTWNIDVNTYEMISSIQYGDDSNPGVALVANKAYASSNSVASTLCFSVQWDAALQFIYNTDATFPTDTSRGNYSGGIKETGYYSVNNIYDMAGNVYEWSYEAYTDPGPSCRGLRGSSYRLGAAYESASERTNFSPEVYYEYIGFRVALYIK